MVSRIISLKGNHFGPGLRDIFCSRDPGNNMGNDLANNMGNLQTIAALARMMGAGGAGNTMGNAGTNNPMANMTAGGKAIVALRFGFS